MLSYAQPNISAWLQLCVVNFTYICNRLFGHRNALMLGFHVSGMTSSKPCFGVQPGGEWIEQSKHAGATYVKRGFVRKQTAQKIEPS